MNMFAIKKGIMKKKKQKKEERKTERKKKEEKSLVAKNIYFTVVNVLRSVFVLVLFICRVDSSCCFFIFVSLVHKSTKIGVRIEFLFENVICKARVGWWGV